MCETQLKHRIVPHEDIDWALGDVGDGHFVLLRLETHVLGASQLQRSARLLSAVHAWIGACQVQQSINRRHIRWICPQCLRQIHV